MRHSFPRKNAQAWEAWSELDRYGRDLDVMGGYPLPLRLADLDRICARYDDPDGIRWRVLHLEDIALKARRAEYEKRRHDKRK